MRFGLLVSFFLLVVLIGVTEVASGTPIPPVVDCEYCDCAESKLWSGNDALWGVRRWYPDDLSRSDAVLHGIGSAVINTENTAKVLADFCWTKPLSSQEGYYKRVTYDINAERSCNVPSSNPAGTSILAIAYKYVDTTNMTWGATIDRKLCNQEQP